MYQYTKMNSGSWWWTGRPGVLQSVGSQRVGHDWATELNWLKINSKWLKDLNIRQDIIKLLEENIGNTFSDINHINVFLGQSPKAIGKKQQQQEWDPINFISFYTAKKTINKKKRQPTHWKKISAKYVADEGLISKIPKQVIQLNNAKQQPNQNMSSRPKQTYFLQRRHTDDQQACNKILNSANYQEM